MPNSGTVRIRSALKRGAWGLTLLSFVVVTAGLAYELLRGSIAVPFKVTDKTYQLTIGGRQAGERAEAAATPYGKAYYLQRASTVSQQEKGLSGTAALDPNSGMLFWNAAEAKQCFWMKDMHYNLDIIWLDRNKKVTHIEYNLSPKTYPKTFCAQGKYVIELNAGEAKRSGITKGQVLTF